MRKWRIVIGVAVVGSMLVGASTASADPSGGPDLSDMSFAVTVTNVDGFPGTAKTFTNCYSFESDGTWIDPAVPPGTWQTTASEASLTHYSTEALGGVLTQTGFVTPSLTLHAKTVVTTPGGEFRFVSNGHAVDQC